MASFDFYLMGMSERNVHKWSLTQAKKKKKEIYSAYSRAGEQGQTVDIEEDPAYRFSNGVPAVR